MRNLAEMTLRRQQLYTLLDDAESVSNCTCPNHSKQERKVAKKAAITLSLIIQEVEWLMGMREETFVDKLDQADSILFSDN
jgi:hypothetical protein